MRPTAVLARLAGLHVGLSVEHGRIKARMLNAGVPIPQEARDLIGQIRGHVLDLLSDKPAYKRPGTGERCDWCREWEQAGQHRRAVVACSECDQEDSS